MGVYPESFMAPMRQDVTTLLARIQPATPESDARLAMGAPRPAAEGHGGEAGHAPAAAPAPEAKGH